MADLGKKCIFVEVASPTAGHEASEYEIEINSNETKSDLEQISEKLRAKSKQISKLLEDGDCIFKAESNRVPGKWVVVGDTSPVKHYSSLKCCITPRKQLIFQTDTIVVNESEPINNDSTNTTSTDLSLREISEEEMVEFVLNNKQGEVMVCENAQQEGDEEVGEKLASSHSVETLDLQNKTTLGDAAGTLEPKTGPSSAKRARKMSSIPKSYEVPTFFSPTIDAKLRDPTSVLDESEYSAVCREVARSMKVHLPSLYPDEVDLDVVSRKLLARYEQLSTTKNDEVLAVKFFSTKLRKIFERWRYESHATAKKPPGRPRKNVVICGPGGKKNVESTTRSSQPVLDVTSYTENMQKLLEAFENNGKKDYPIELLMELTFEGRRQAVCSGIPQVQIWVKENCPFLRHSKHLFKEFDRIVAPMDSSCSKFRQAWMDLVPSILNYAESRNTKRLKDVLKAPRFSRMKNDFDVRSRAAMELLPLVLVGRDKSIRGPRFFVDFREESANMLAAAKEIPHRGNPFLLYIGSQGHLFVDSKPLIDLSEMTSTDCLLALFAAYYVFDMKYCEAVKPSLLLIQHLCLGQPDESTQNCSSVVQFLYFVDRSKRKLSNSSGPCNDEDEESVS